MELNLFALVSSPSMILQHAERTELDEEVV